MAGSVVLMGQGYWIRGGGGRKEAIALTERKLSMTCENEKIPKQATEVTLQRSFFHFPFRRRHCSSSNVRFACLHLLARFRFRDNINLLLPLLLPISNSINKFPCPAQLLRKRKATSNQRKLPHTRAASSRSARNNRSNLKLMPRSLMRYLARWAATRHTPDSQQKRLTPFCRQARAEARASCASALSRDAPCPLGVTTFVLAFGQVSAEVCHFLLSAYQSEFSCHKRFTPQTRRPPFGLR